MNIVVLCGGLSNERDVSLSSGNGVANALRDRGHNVVLMDLFFGCLEEYTDPKELFLRKRENTVYSVEQTSPDLEAVKAAGLPTITPVLICNTDDYPTFNTFVGKEVTNADVVIALAK